MKKIVNKSTEYINFYIWLAKLSKKYPKFKKVEISTNDVTKLGYIYLHTMMSRDVDLWM